MRLALLGDPVDHSRSPAIHDAALAAVGIEGSYEARRTTSAEISGVIDSIRTGLLDGANVTMPLKQAALEAVDSASLAAIRCGAVNTILLRAGAVVGDNTDIGGIGDVWRHRSLPVDAPVLLLGGGGAAGAALVALEGRSIRIAARSAVGAARLVALVGSDALVVPWETSGAGAVVVNATPIGMRGEEIPASILRGAIGLLDMAYGPGPTPAVRASSSVMPVADGVDLLVAQAARSFELWTGMSAPRDVMDAAARA